MAVVFFNNEKHEMTRKISWEEQRILAVKAASQEIFSGRFVLFVVKKEFLCYPDAYGAGGGGGGGRKISTIVLRFSPVPLPAPVTV